MSETTYDNQAPIFRFLRKHRWRFLMAIVFSFFYLSPTFHFLSGSFFPRQFTSNSCRFIATSQILSQAQIKEELKTISNSLSNDDALLGLINEYDLLAEERKRGLNKNSLLEKMRESIHFNFSSTPCGFGDYPCGYISIIFDHESPEKIKTMLNNLVRKFETNLDIQLIKDSQDPVTVTLKPLTVDFLKLAFWNLLFYSVLFIFLWEIPNLFYSFKTQTTVFNPIKSDWQDELTDAKLRNQTWKIFEINIRYSTAFSLAMLQKSPLGSLLEIFRKIAS